MLRLNSIWLLLGWSKPNLNYVSWHYKCNGMSNVYSWKVEQSKASGWLRIVIWKLTLRIHLQRLLLWGGRGRHYSFPQAHSYIRTIHEKLNQLYLSGRTLRSTFSCKQMWLKCDSLGHFVRNGHMSTNQWWIIYLVFTVLHCSAPISSMIFGTNALFTKPAQSLAPMMVVHILSRYGYKVRCKEPCT